MNLDGINVGTGEELLKIAQARSTAILARASVGEQRSTIFFLQRRIAGKNVVFLLVARLIAHDPIRHNKIGERVSRAPGVIALIENRFVKDQVHDGIGNVANLVHGVALFLRKAFDDAARDELRSRHDHGFRGNCLQLRALHVGDLHFAIAGNHGDRSRARLHAVSELRLQNFS